MSKQAFLNGLNDAQQFLNQNTPLNQSSVDQFKSDGFLLPATFSADGNGLPYTKVPVKQDAQIKRNIITWFVPEFGIVRMYVNPSSIVYTHKKLISKDRTKGGYTLQYWGEELSQLNISGTTGSSGIEGINTLYEIYRAEQYAFDGTGLSLAANNSNSPNLLNSLLGSSASGATSAIGSLLGLESPNSALSPNNITSLAQLAFTVEMYYGGWVYRGFFENMTITEEASDFLIKYQMTFVVTQRRGYRTNYFPWSRNPKNGPSDSGNIENHSFSGNIKPGT